MTNAVRGEQIKQPGERLDESLSAALGVTPSASALDAFRAQWEAILVAERDADVKGARIQLRG